MTEVIADPFRKEYQPLDDKQKEKISSIKDKAEALFFEMTDLGGMTVDLRASALAKTNLEQSVMWPIKSIT